jgi:hypothetical protein
VQLQPEMNLTREEIWDEVKTRTRAEDAKEILVYAPDAGEHANLFNGLKDLQ